MIRSHKCFFIFFLILYNTSFYVFSQSVEDDFSATDYFDSADDFEDDVISVKAERISQKISDDVEQKQVINEEEIRKSGSKTVGDALKTLPGVTVSNASAGNSNESVTMQGLGNGYVKIMIDGVTVATDVSGSTPVFQIPVENIERIEVINGADSVLYGSEAMGGVINIVTKQNNDKESNDEGEENQKVKVSGNVTEEAGFSPVTLDWKNYTAASLFATGSHLSNALIASFDYTPGKQKTTADALAGSITYYENSKKILAFARDTLTWREKWGNLGLYGLYADSYQVSNFTKTGFDKGSDMEYRSLRGEAGITGKYILGERFYIDGFTAGKFYYLDTKYNVKAGAYSSTKETESDSFHWESDLRSYWKVADFQDLLIGANVNLESIDGSSFDERKYALETALFAQDSILLFDKKFTLVPGLRFDLAPSVQNSAVNFMATPKLSAKYNPSDKTALRLSYAMGYKIPSLQEKYWIFKHNYAPGSGNFILYGNPALVPEKSHSINAGLEQNVSDLFTFSLGGFFNYIIDLIDSVVLDADSSPQIREYRNVDKALTYGGEFSISSDLDRFKIKVGYAYTGAVFYDELSKSWQDLALRVNHRITAQAEYQIPVIETLFSVSAQWNSPQLLSSGTNYYTPDFLMLSSDISKKFFDEKLLVYLGINNILNNLHFIKGTNGENQKDYYGLNEGTVLRLGAKLKF